MNILLITQFADYFSQKMIDDGSRYFATYHNRFYLALQATKHQIIISNDESLVQVDVKKIDLVINLYYYRNKLLSEFISLGFCLNKNIKYLGCPPNIKAIDVDKVLGKLVAEHLNIDTPNYLFCSSKSEFPSSMPFQPPYFVKPRFSSSSKNIDETSICQNYTALRDKVFTLLENKIPVLIEQFITGDLVTVPIIYNQKQSLITNPYHLYVPNSNVVTHYDKRHGNCQRSFNVNSKICKMAKETSKVFFDFIQPCDYARIDYIYNPKEDKLYFLEINTTPNLGIYGGYSQSFINEFFNNYEELVSYLIDIAVSREK